MTIRNRRQRSGETRDETESMTEGREPRWPVGVPLAKAETEEESRPDAHEHGWIVIFKVGVAGDGSSRGQ